MGFLEEIVAELQAEMATGRYDAGVGNRAPVDRPSLREAVERGRAQGALIAEYKRASPGRAAPELPVRSVEEFARVTDLPAVVGYSCLATPPRFGGSPATVAELARRSRRPILFKEFVVHPSQLEVARRAGASATLLIARLATAGLLDRQLADLADQAHRLGLEVLLELHAPEELPLLDGVHPDLVGVNVRDLESLRFERARAAATLRAVRTLGLAPVVGLSGVETAEDARQFWALGCDALVVGTGVALAPDPAAFLRSLRRPEATP